MAAPRVVASFASAAELLHAYDTEVPKGGLLARGATLQNPVPMSECSLEVKVAGETVALGPARVAAVFPGLGVAVLFDKPPSELVAAVARLRAPARAPSASQVAGPALEPPHVSAELGDEDAGLDDGPTEPPPPPPPGSDEEAGGHFGTAAERLAGLTVAQKMQLAISGGRDIRLQIFREHVKTLHVYALKNPRIGLDEVTWAAKQPSLSPDALKLISENTAWGGNAQICSALVQNPRTPIPIAIKLLSRIPMSDLKQIAKGRGRAQIVQAARKLVIPS